MTYKTEIMIVRDEQDTFNSVMKEKVFQLRLF